MTTPKKGGIDEVIKILQEEVEQERNVVAGSGSIFAEAPSDDTLRARSREYDDPVKHWVRKSLWLRLVRQLHRRRGRPLRLLTLPGRHAIEVKLYEKEGILATINDSHGERLDVVAFEYEPTAYGLLATAEPRLDRVINGSLVDALVKSDDPKAEELRGAFPFDVVNLDLTSNLVAPREAPYGEVLQAVEACLTRQRTLDDEWLLMITFRAVQGHTNAETERQLQQIFEQNLADYDQLRTTFVELHGDVSPSELLESSYEGALGAFFAKWLVDASVRNGWEVARLEHAFYRREALGGYQIRKLVARLRPQHVDDQRIPHSGAELTGEQLVSVERALKSGLGRDYDDYFARVCLRKPDLEDALTRELAEFTRDAAPE